MKDLGLVLLAVMAALAVGTGPAVAIQTIGSDIDRTDTLPMGYYRGYQLAGPAPVKITITDVAKETDRTWPISVDFYVFTGANLAEYEDVNATGFHYQDQLESSVSFNAVITEPDLILVVDNARVSTSGADPSANVTYHITVEFAVGSFGGSPLSNPLIIVGLVGAVVAVPTIVAVVYRRQLRARKMNATPPVPEGSLPPPPPPGDTPPPPPPQRIETGSPAESILSTPAAPQVPQEAQIPQQAEKLRRSTLTISALTIGMAIAYVVVQDIITMFLAIIFMFTTLGHVSKINKMRKASGGT